MSTDVKPKDSEIIYQLEGRPSFKTAFPLGLQHVLAMFTGNLAPIMIVASACGLSYQDTVMMVQCAMFMSGITTLLQLYPIKIGKFQIGGGLPIVMGTSFNFVPTAVTIAATYGIGGILGASILGSFSEFFMGFFFKPLKKFFPPIVVGSVLTSIGFNLLRVGTNYIAGGGSPETNPNYASIENLFLGFLVFFVIIILQKFGKGMWKISAILIGLIIGYIVAILLNQVDLTEISKARFFSFPQPFYFKPIFSLKAALSFAAIYIVSGLETIGNTSGVTVASFNREATSEEISGSIVADALGSGLASVFNALPNTVFGQNVGIVAMTKVINKWCIAMGAFTLIVAGLFPKIGAVFATIPSSVLGGAVITVFAMILINGMKLIAKAGFCEKNMLILGITFALGIGLAGSPDIVMGLPDKLQLAFGGSNFAKYMGEFFQFIFKDSVASTCIVAIVANAIFAGKIEKE